MTRFCITLFYLTVLVFITVTGSAQSISAADQKRVELVRAWMDGQMQKGHVPTPWQMDSVNKAVKAIPDGDLVPEAKEAHVSTAADKVNNKTVHVIAGGTVKVPEGKTWWVKRVFVTEGPGGRHILVTSAKFDKPLKAGETLTAPIWSAESSLLANDGSTATYIFEIEEK